MPAKTSNQARVRRACERGGRDLPQLEWWLAEFAACSKLGRAGGAVVINRTHMHRGVEYDPRLVNTREIDEMAVAVATVSALNHAWGHQHRLEMVVAEAERVRADEEWPEDLANTLFPILSKSDTLHQLETLKPGSQAFMVAFERYRDNSREYHGSKWEAWWHAQKEKDAE